MANWQFTLDISEAWGKSKEDEITTVELSKKIIEGLEVIKPRFAARFPGHEDMTEGLDEIIEEFKEYVEVDDDDKDAFNIIFTQLYDWADQPLDGGWPPKKPLWVKTEI